VIVDPYGGQRGDVRAALRRAQQQVQRRLSALAADEPAPGEADRTRQAAEWLLALSSQVQPGQAELVVPLDEESLVISLDSRLGPVAQAEGVFIRAAKLARAAAFIPQRRAQLEQDLALLDQLGYDLAQATNQPEIAAVRAELRAAGLGPKEGASGDRGRRGVELGKARPSASKAGQPLRFRSPSGFEIVVGRNARQNEHVTFAVAHPGDWWLHVRGQPGAHVVVKGAGREPDSATMQAAAQLAAYYSSARGERAADVILARKRDVSRAPGGKVGQVMVAKEKVLVVPAELPPAVAAIK
jgi:predicted ribosome quality control (RQC) complex YloA/Tae2 family protein